METENHLNESSLGSSWVLCCAGLHSDSAIKSGEWGKGTPNCWFVYKKYWSVHISPRVEGWVLLFPRQYTQGDLCTEKQDNHLGSLISCLFSTYPVIGVIEKVTWHWRWWDLLGNIKGRVLCQKTFMMCKLNIVQCIYRRFSDMRLIDVWRTECLSSIWIFHQIVNRWRQFEWSPNAFN